MQRGARSEFREMFPMQYDACASDRHHLVGLGYPSGSGLPASCLFGSSVLDPLCWTVSFRRAGLSGSWLLMFQSK